MALCMYYEDFTTFKQEYLFLIFGNLGNGLIHYEKRTLPLTCVILNKQINNKKLTWIFNVCFLFQGESPYLRATYRYTPLLAWVLQPNILLTASFGKLLFILLDIFTGYLIYKITLSSGSSSRFSSLCAATWLLNPLPMTVSSRGNAESIMTFLVLLSLKLIQDRRQFFAGLVYGLSVHFKIYPVIYAIPIYLYINYEDGSAGKFSWRSLLPTRDRLLFIFSAATVFFSVTLFYYRV